MIIPDRLSELISKGEITARYYNPGGLYSEVHILMTNDDVPDKGLLQKAVGEAQLFLHNLPSGKDLFLKSLGWRPALLSRWARRGVNMASQIKPQLIRCHGNHLNGFLAAEIKRILGVPYVISIHTNPDENRKYWCFDWREKCLNYAAKSIEKIAIKYADVIIPVYKSICSYLEHLDHKKIEIIYNVVNPEFLKKKCNYSLHSPVKIISVGRLIPGKCPDNIIRSVMDLDVDVELTIIGNGPLRPYLEDVAKSTEMSEKIKFIPSLSNDELCSILRDNDIFAVHSEYHGIPKTLLEASLTGLPIIVNKIDVETVPELSGNWLMLVDNNVDGYRKALQKLISDTPLRRELGRRATIHAHTHWEPTKMEAKYVEVYRRVMAEALSACGTD